MTEITNSNANSIQRSLQSIKGKNNHILTVKIDNQKPWTIDLRKHDTKTLGIMLAKLIKGNGKQTMQLTIGKYTIKAYETPSKNGTGHLLIPEKIAGSNDFMLGKSDGTKIRFNKSLLDSSKENAQDFAEEITGNNNGKRMYYSSSKGYMLGGPFMNEGYLAEKDETKALRKAVAFHEENGLTSTKAYKNLKARLAVKDKRINEQEKKLNRVLNVLKTGNLKNYGYDLNSKKNYDQYVKAVRMFKQDLKKLACKGKLTLDNINFKGFESKGFDIKGLLTFVLNEARGDIKKGRIGAYLMMAPMKSPRGAVYIPSNAAMDIGAGMLEDIKKNLGNLESQMRAKGIDVNKDISFNEFLKLTWKTIKKPFVGVEMSPQIKAEFLQVPTKITDQDSLAAAISNKSIFSVRASMNLNVPTEKIDSAVKNVFATKNVKGYEGLRKNVSEENLSVKYFYYMSPTPDKEALKNNKIKAEQLMVPLIGGKCNNPSKGKFHYIDPSTGADYYGNTMDEISEQFIKNTGLPEAGKIAYKSDSGRIVEKDVPYSGWDRARDGAISLLTVAGTVSMIVGGEPLALFTWGCFAGSLVLEASITAEKWGQGRDDIPPLEYVNLATQLLLVGGGLGRSISMLKAGKLTQGSAQYNKLVNLANNFGKVSTVGFAGMLGLTGKDGIEALIEQDPKKAAVVLQQILLLVAAYKAQKYFAKKGMAKQRASIEKDIRVQTQKLESLIKGDKVIKKSFEVLTKSNDPKLKLKAEKAIRARFKNQNTRLYREIKSLRTSLAKAKGSLAKNNGNFAAATIEILVDGKKLDVSFMWAYSNLYGQKLNSKFTGEQLETAVKTNYYPKKGNKKSKYIPLEVNNENQLNKPDSYPRYGDSEFKLFNDLYFKIEATGVSGSKVRGTIHIFTERFACKSCAKVIRDFKKDFPNVDIIIHSNESNGAIIKPDISTK